MDKSAVGWQCMWLMACNLCNEKCQQKVRTIYTHTHTHLRRREATQLFKFNDLEVARILCFLLALCCHFWLHFHDVFELSEHLLWHVNVAECAVLVTAIRMGGWVVRWSIVWDYLPLFVWSCQTMWRPLTVIIPSALHSSSTMQLCLCSCCHFRCCGDCCDKCGDKYTPTRSPRSFISPSTMSAQEDEVNIESFVLHAYAHKSIAELLSIVTMADIQPLWGCIFWDDTLRKMYRIRVTC